MVLALELVLKLVLALEFVLMLVQPLGLVLVLVLALELVLKFILALELVFLAQITTRRFFSPRSIMFCHQRPIIGLDMNTNYSFLDAPTLGHKL